MYFRECYIAVYDIDSNTLSLSLSLVIYHIISFVECSRNEIKEFLKKQTKLNQLLSRILTKYMRFIKNCITNLRTFFLEDGTVASTTERETENFYKLVPVLRKEAEPLTVQARLVADGQGGRDTRPTYRRLDDQIHQLLDQCSSGGFSTARLLKGCSRLYGPSDGTGDILFNDEAMVTRLCIGL